MYNKPNVPRSIGGVLDDTMQLYKASFSKCWLPAVLAAVLATALGVYQLTFLPAPPGARGSGLEAIFAQSVSSSPLSTLVSLLTVLIEGMFYGTLIHIISAVTRGESPQFGTSFSAMLRRLPAMIGASLTVGVIVLAGFVIAFMPFIVVAAGAPSGATIAQLAARAGGAILLCLVLMIPLLYVMLRLQLFIVPLISESRGPWQSIAASWRLVGGNWWRTSTAVFVMGIVLYVLLIVVLAVSGGIAVMVAGLPRGTSQVFGATVVVGMVVGGVIRIVSTPLLAALYVVLYQDLQLRKGGTDLEARLGALPKG
jgi:hypothetical protein